MKIPVEHPDVTLFIRRPPLVLEPVRVSGGPRHGAPADADEDEAPERPAAPPPRAHRPVAAPRAEPQRVAPAPPPPPPPPPSPAPELSVEVEVVLAVPDAPPESTAGDVEDPEGIPAPEGPADFWTREAFGLEIPEGGFGVADSAAAPGAPARKKRRRRRRPAAPSAVPSA